MAWSIGGSSAQYQNASTNKSSISAWCDIYWSSYDSYAGYSTSGRINVGGTEYGYTGPSEMNYVPYYPYYGSRSGGQRVGEKTVEWTHSTSGYRDAKVTHVYFNGGGGYAPGDLNYNTDDYGALDYDRSAYTPSMGTTSRDSTTSATVRYNQNGSVNGPTTYVVQRATDSGFSNVDKTWTNPSTTFTDSTLNANTTYYYRAYAYGDEGGNKVSGYAGPLYGQPGAPSMGTPSQISTAQKRISVPFSAPGYTGSGITSYTINRTGTPGGSFTAYSSPYIDTDTNLVPGNVYSYWATASTSQYTSGGSSYSGSIAAPGAPYAPLSEPTFTVNGLDVEVTSAAVHSIYGNGGVAIDTANSSQGYFVQYQTATTQDGTYGFNGVAGAWSPAVKMENQTSRKHKYTSLTPAIFYKFRTYAANSVQFDRNNTTQLYYPHNNPAYTANFATNSTGSFLAAGGRRWNGTEWTPTATAKRWTGTEWTPFTVAKRWDGSQWANLS